MQVLLLLQHAIIKIFSFHKIVRCNIGVTLVLFQNSSNEDTEWNDVLRAKGILPPKEKEISEDEIVNMIEETIQKKEAESKLNFFGYVHLLLYFHIFTFLSTSLNLFLLKLL